ncbi:hypothetical protein [Thalassococcus sp. S3]|uniref:hypothetical protein n=1 Tax=Thalassococcus sp. S3 TaxID=2017482 RepID=UPI0010243212|nr:hypothetical protein [Thalassococcus sp. S3]QBF31561.1 hypothetical protein CFI11_10075 [Thalassococcus sp. S3]
MAYIANEQVDLLQVECRPTRTALEDAAHLGLTEDELAQLIVLIVRDPTVGRKEGDWYRYVSRLCEAKYMLYQASEELLVVHLLRLMPLKKPPKDFSGVARIGRDIVVGVLRQKITELLRKAEE